MKPHFMIHCCNSCPTFDFLGPVLWGVSICLNKHTHQDRDGTVQFWKLMSQASKSAEALFSSETSDSDAESVCGMLRWQESAIRRMPLADFSFRDENAMALIILWPNEATTNKQVWAYYSMLYLVSDSLLLEALSGIISINNTAVAPPSKRSFDDLKPSDN